MSLPEPSKPPVVTNGWLGENGKQAQPPAPVTVRLNVIPVSPALSGQHRMPPLDDELELDEEDWPLDEEEDDELELLLVDDEEDDELLDELELLHSHPLPSAMTSH